MKFSFSFVVRFKLDCIRQKCDFNSLLIPCLLKFDFSFHFAALRTNATVSNFTSQRQTKFWKIKRRLAASTCCRKSKHFACILKPHTRTSIIAAIVEFRQMRLIACVRMKLFNFISSFFFSASSARLSKTKKKENRKRKQSPALKSIYQNMPSAETRHRKLCFHFQFIFVKKRREKKSV